MFDSFMVSQILQEVSITIVFMVYSLSWCYMLCLLQTEEWLRSTSWLSWLGRLLQRIWEQQNKSWAWKYTET